LFGCRQNRMIQHPRQLIFPESSRAPDFFFCSPSVAQL
jgi:hypothetical protein